MTSALRRLTPVMLLALAVLLVASACGDDDGEPGAAAPDPQQLLLDAADRMEQARSFHFVLEHENGGIEIVRGIEMTRAEGDVDGATRLQAEVEGTLGPFSFEVGIIILPGESWIQNPITQRWEREEISIDALFDPSDGIVALMRSARSPEILRRERIGGVDTYRVTAMVESGDLTVFPGAEPGRDVPATAWIGVDAPFVYLLEIRGPIADGEADDIIRRLELSRFDEPVDIAPPR